VERIKQNFALVEEKIKDVVEKDYLRNWQPPISGTDIMAHFNIIKREHIGILKNDVKQAILDGEVSDNKQDAMVYLKARAKKLNIDLK